MAAGAGRRWPGGAGVQGRGRRGVQAPSPAQLRELQVVLDAGPAAWGWEGSVLDAGPHRRGGAPPVRRDLQPGGAGSAVAPDRLERAGPCPPGGRAGTRPAIAAWKLEQVLAGGKRTAADLGAWLVFEDESGQGLRPPKGRTRHGAATPRW